MNNLQKVILVLFIIATICNALYFQANLYAYDTTFGHFIEFITHEIVILLIGGALWVLLPKVKA